MNWWRSKPKPLPIPPYKPDEPKVEPKPEPMDVHEVSSETGLHRFMDIWNKLKGQ